jgi:MFS transporter, DHA2 family, multidrug resistance protein
MPSTLALISTMFPDPRQRGTAIGVWASCMMAGAALGPVVGGVLLDAFWWGAAFLMAVPVTVVLLAAGPLLLPETRDPGAGRVDGASVALSLAAVLALVYGLKEVTATGVHLRALVALAAGAVVAVVFVRRQRRLSDPLLDPALFRVRAVATALTVILVGGVFLSGIFMLVSQHLQLVAGLSPTAAGLWLAPVGVAVAVGATVAPALARSVRPAHVLAGGLTLSAAGCLVLTQVGTGGGFALLVVGVVVLYLGVGPTMALGTELVVGSVPPAKAGSASATSESATELGAALGIALVGSLAAAIYRSTVQLPAHTAAAAGESLAAATALAQEQPAPQAAAVLAAAREAFTAGLTSSATVGCIGFAVLAVLTVLRLRGPAA